MSISYTCYLVPEPGAVHFVPSGPDLVAVADVLIGLRWTKASDRYEVRRANPRTSAIHAASMALELDLLLGSGQAFVLELPEVPETELWPDAPLDADGYSRKYEFTRDSSGVLRPEYCFGARLCCAPSLLSVPPDNINGDTPTPCPECGADVLVDIARDDGVLAGVNWAEFFKSVPERCPSCSAALNAGDLVMQMRSGTTGERIPEPAPFGRFVIALDAASPECYPHAVEERLLARLRDAVGVSYRNVGRWR